MEFVSNRMSPQGGILFLLPLLVLWVSAASVAQQPVETPPATELTCQNRAHINPRALVEAPALQPVVQQFNTLAADNADDPRTARWRAIVDNATHIQVSNCVHNGDSLVWIRLVGTLSASQVQATLPGTSESARVIQEASGGVDVFLAAPGTPLPPPVASVTDAATMQDEAALHIFLEQPDLTEAAAGFVRAEVVVLVDDGLTIRGGATASDEQVAVEWRDNLVAVLVGVAAMPTLAVAGISDIIADAAQGRAIVRVVECLSCQLRSLNPKP